MDSGILSSAMEPEPWAGEGEERKQRVAICPYHWVPSCFLLHRVGTPELLLQLKISHQCSSLQPPRAELKAHNFSFYLALPIPSEAHELFSNSTFLEFPVTPSPYIGPQTLSPLCLLLIGAHFGSHPPSHKEAEIGKALLLVTH